MKVFAGKVPLSVDVPWTSAMQRCCLGGSDSQKHAPGTLMKEWLPVIKSLKSTSSFSGFLLLVWRIVGSHICLFLSPTDLHS